MAPLFKGSFLVLLASLLAIVPVGAEGKGPVLHREKRNWISAPRHLKENQDYTGYPNIARIRSDKENYTKIFYSLSGPGVDQPPLNVFSVDPNSGFVKIHSILDREEVANYTLKGIARYPDGSLAESDIDLRITVDDENDNPPIVKLQQVGYVDEASAAGTVVMKVICTDADEPGTQHTKLFYQIASESNPDGLFYINSQTGEVMVQESSLDRETRDSYKLTIIAVDMNGQPEGNTGTGEIEVKITDINDNIPVLDKDSYEGSIEENTVNKEVMRFKAFDMDVPDTANWLADFKIISGNEAGYFDITTDPKTNEGILIINKPLDYEDLKEINLGVVVNNKAPYNFGTGGGGGGSVYQKPYNVKINVLNEKEGPRFQPGVKVVPLSEDSSSIDLQKIITNYAAIDTDTLQTATNVRYAKIRDEDNWLIIDEKTADIRLNKMPDRESKYLKNGTYYAEIICITNDMPSKTATGTIAIQVEDFNDHCPTLTSTTETMCHWDNFVYVTAKDEDDFPNSAPFDFTVIEESSKGKWVVEPLNESTIILREQEKLWPGIYQVAVEVKDQQGKSCGDVQMDVVVCTCHEDSRTCVPRSATSSNFSTSGILLLLLGLLLLLLVPLFLMFCLCGGAAGAGNFKTIPYDTKQQLISYHTEGQGEDKFEHSSSLLGNSASPNPSGSRWWRSKDQRHEELRKGADLHVSCCVYLQKSNHAAQQFQEKNAMMVYDYEGKESPAGSVGCCSLHENDDDLSFLNDLGPKFKTLAEICTGSAIVTESVPPPRAVDRVNVDHTASVAGSASSTFIQEERVSETIQVPPALPKVQVQDKIVVPSQTVLVQQPAMYYTTTPMYVMESNPQMVLVAGGAQQAVGQVGQVGLSQGLVQVGGLQAPQGVVLVDRQVGGLTGRVSHGLSQGTRQVLVENGSLSGQQVAHIAPGYVQVQMPRAKGSEVRSQGKQVKTQSYSLASRGSVGSSELLVENGSLAGQQVAHIAPGFVQVQVPREIGSDLRSQGKQVKIQSYSHASRGSAGSSEDYAQTTTPKIQGSQRVVVQHKKVSVTEKTLDSNTGV
uniref:Desmoglein-2-like n=1 Tax=Takifugu rubripes TaxID=31033 RepID=A0A674MY22_TAKRU